MPQELFIIHSDGPGSFEVTNAAPGQYPAPQSSPTMVIPVVQGEPLRGQQIKLTLDPEKLRAAAKQEAGR